MAINDDLISVFEERAENLSESELRKWTVLTDTEKQIVKKLMAPGAKLISGPRGSGKSTLFKIAFFELQNTKAALPIYVNFSKALALEPLFHVHANASAWFRQWVLAKILVGLKQTCAKWQVDLTARDEAVAEGARAFILELEAGKAPTASPDLAPSQVADLIRGTAEKSNVSRSVLLLDDAAHAFSVKQQREFFEVFAELRSREISAKAAIYPGVTSFSPSFQVGHEAEEIQAWIRVDGDGFLESMRKIANVRFPELENQLGDNYFEAIDALALASFGLPRGFVNMISEVSDSVGLGQPVRKAVLEAITSNSESVGIQFKNIADKLPRFANYIDVGLRLEEKGKAALRAFNDQKSLLRKTATLALSEPWPSELDRVLRFMEYAGLFRKIDGLSKGEKGSYCRYVVHYSRMIASNTLFLGKNYKLTAVVDALKRPLAHALVKTKPETLLGANYSQGCTLALPPCPKCSTARVTEDQKFCMNCGEELRSASIYLELFKASVDKLPIPSRKITALKDAGFQSVGQILSDENQKFRRPGSGIGPVWAKRILTVAEEFVSV